jgi:hypothetical protein
MPFTALDDIKRQTKTQEWGKDQTGGVCTRQRYLPVSVSLRKSRRSHPDRRPHGSLLSLRGADLLLTTMAGHWGQRTSTLCARRPSPASCAATSGAPPTLRWRPPDPAPAHVQRRMLSVPSRNNRV